MTRSILVGDIGGTHVRFAIAEFIGQWYLRDKQDIEAGSSSFQQLLSDYLDQRGTARPSNLSFAVAGPVTDGTVIFTNRQWRLSESELLKFGFSRAVLLNDFAALAHAAPLLTSEQLFALGPAQPGTKDAPIAVMGAGTGFGTSCLISRGGRMLPLASEAGHIGFASNDDREDAVLRILRRQFGRVSVERLLSGPGLENLLAALRELHGPKGETMNAAAIISQAEAGDALCQEAVAMFCAAYGSVAGDLALALGARGGVYLAGGIAPKIRNVLAASHFRRRFEDKGRLSYYLRPIPTRIILDLDATMFGAAQAFDSANMS